MTDRRWTAKLRFPDGTQLDLEPPSKQLENYEGDLLSSAASSAVRQASELLGAESPDGFCIYIYKTTKARGTEYDRCYGLVRDSAGRLRGIR